MSISSIQAQLPIQSGLDWFVAKPVLEKSLEWQYGILAVMLLLAVATLANAFKMSRRAGSYYPIYVCLGAALATFYEPLGDLMAHVTYHEANQISFTHAFGFRTPLWVVPTYVVFFGGTILFLLEQINRGPSLKKWMILFFAFIPGGWLWEVPLLEMDSIAYYGANQPFQILGYPLWMAFANTATMFVVSVAVFFLLKTALVRSKPFLLIPLIPMLIVGANGGTALPLGSAINATLDVTIVNVAATLSALLAILYVWICGSLIVESARNQHLPQPA